MQEKIITDPQNLNEIVAKNLRDFRLERGLDRWEIAKLLGIKYQSYSRWEQGLVDMKLSSLERLAEALEIKPVK